MIFHKLAEHYGNKLHLLEDNSYLKSQSEEYKRQIEEQLSKIKSYEKLIVDIPKQNEAVQREIEGIVR